MKKAALGIGILALDQILKYLALKNLLPQLGGFLTYICNPSISWGISVKGILFWLLWIISILAVLRIASKSSWNIYLVAVIAGSLSNLADRIFHGCVIDYIHISNHFPIFNLADMMITGGIILFLLSTSLSLSKKSNQLVD